MMPASRPARARTRLEVLLVAGLSKSRKAPDLVRAGSRCCSGFTHMIFLSDLRLAFLRTCSIELPSTFPNRKDSARISLMGQ